MKAQIQHCRSYLVKLGWLPPLIARVVIGIVFIESGWGKLHDIEKVIGFFTQLGIPFPTAQAHFIAATELIAGGMILIGFLTRLASIPLTVIMTVAIATAKSSEISTLTDVFGFSEFLYIVLLSWLIIAGPGSIAADRALDPSL